MAAGYRLKRIAAGTLVAATLCLVADRVALYTWGFRVISLYRQLQRTKNPALLAGSLANLTEPPSYMVSAEPGRRDFMLSLEHSSVRPDRISVDNQWVHLSFLPPLLAWSTRIYPFQPAGTPQTWYRPVDHYEYRISVRDRGESSPEFKLYRVVHFELHELSEGTRFPELFP